MIQRRLIYDIATKIRRPETNIMRNHLATAWSKLKISPWYAMVLVAVGLAFVLELLVCNHYYFGFSADDYQRYEVNLPWQQHINRNAVIVAPENAALTLNSLNFHVSNVYVETWAPNPHKVAARIVMTDNYQSYAPYPVTKFELVPGGTQQARLIRVWDKGIAQTLTLAFDPQDIAGGIAITKLVLNEQPSLEFSWIRWALMSLVLSAALLTLRFRFYQERYDASKRLHRALNYGVLALVVLMSLVIFHVTNPRNTQPFGFDFLGPGVMILTDNSHSLLRPMPTNEEELANSDAYVQLLDAFLKGQLHLDFTPDPRLDQLTNVYDQSERAQYPDLRYLYDRPYYQGKIYVAFGIAPLFMIYAPIYFLTGMAPSLALAALIGALLDLVAVFAAMNLLVKYFELKPNALLFYLSELASLCALHIFSMQVYPSHYLMVYFTLIFWVAIIVSCVAALYHDQLSPRKAHVLWSLVGLGVVMVVISRPQVLLLVLAFTAPFCWGYLRAHLEHKRALIINAICALVPVSLGAVLVMFYNYARFDSIFEFGYNYQISGRDVRGEGLSFSFDIIKSWWWYFIVEPLNYLKNFPFVSYPYLNNGDDGGYRYVVNRVSVLAVPYFWALLLLVRHCISTKRLAPELSLPERFAVHQNWALFLGVAAMLLVSYVVYIKFGIGFRYQVDMLSVLVFVAFLLIVEHLHYSANKFQQIIYCVALYCLVKTIAIGFCLPFSNFEETLSAMNPDVYVGLKEIFDPLGFK